MDTKTYTLEAIDSKGDLIMEGVALTTTSIDDITVIQIPSMVELSDEEAYEISQKFSVLFPEKCVIITHDEIKFFKLTEVIN